MEENEMTREEALKQIREWDFLNDEERAALETLIPELRESEDDRIRKAIIEHFKQSETEFPGLTFGGYYYADVLAYLEKQKEQKPAEWSEEDSKRYISIGTTLETSAVLSKEDYDANMAWLRELVNAKKYSGPQSHWKPSEEQMNLLLNIEGILRERFQYVRATQLAELYEQLKKLI